MEENLENRVYLEKIDNKTFAKQLAACFLISGAAAIIGGYIDNKLCGGDGAVGAAIGYIFGGFAVGSYYACHRKTSDEGQGPV
jgi:hypothetical protein